ncbi:hypothetical protein TYRP_019447 [Tyrophagus putrescentiae]|nr:hypothetical protein TYRP_019447 [Tyrophagus putrescentiae]
MLVSIYLVLFTQLYLRSYNAKWSAIETENRSKKCQQFKPCKFSHLTSHHSFITAFDHLNRDIVSKAIASAMIFLTPYNIHLVTTFFITTKSGSTLTLKATGEHGQLACGSVSGELKP